MPLAVQYLWSVCDVCMQWEAVKLGYTDVYHVMGVNGSSCVCVYLCVVAPVCHTFGITKHTTLDLAILIHQQRVLV